MTTSRRGMRWVGLWLFGVTALWSAVLPAELADLESYVDRVRTQFEVPGVAIAIVKEGEVVLERGFGVKKLGAATPVDAHTRFAIASNTKAFTAAALAILMDEGKLQWGDRVIEHLPWFQMADPYVTREMTVRDLLVHRSGLALGAGDLLYWPATTYTAEEVVRRLRFVPLETSFRSAYAYDNILYGVAGLVIQQAAGKSWADFLRERIFQPLGMAETSPLPLEPTAANNVATGHAKFDFKDLRPLSNGVAFENNAPAGAIYSSVHDLAKWMRLQLAGGRYRPTPDGAEARLFSVARQREMWTVVTPMPIGESPVAALAAVRPNFLGYGHGWVLGDYRGRKLVSHTGGWPGMVSRLTLVPELELGVVVLTNQEVGAAFQAVTWKVIDAYFAAPKTDWIAAYTEAVRKSAERADDHWARREAARDPAAKPRLPPARLLGTYRDTWYGDVTVSEVEGKLVLQFERTAQLRGELEPWQHSTYIVRWADRSLNADAWVTFALTPDGEVEGVKMEAISPLTDFSFDFHHLALKPVRK